MAKLTNDDVYRTLSGEQMIELAKLYGRLAVTLDGFWFLGVEKQFGTAKAIEIDEAVWAEYGRTKGKLLKRFLAIDGACSIEQTCRALLLTPIFGNLGAQAEVRDGRCILSVVDCHPQRARLRKGLGEFPCKGVGLAYFGGLIRELNPDLTFRCVFCPPDEHGPDVWCEWEIWLP